MGDVTNDKIKKALIKRGYIYKDIIGKGGFGEVYLCERVTEKNKS
jgi:serine/threonine protein kinase